MKAKEHLSTTQRRAGHLLSSFKHTGFNHLFEEISLSASLLIASFIAIGYIFYLFPVKFLSGHSALFDRLEPATSLSGWWAFKNGHWRFPLLSVRLLNAPEGANIAFTSSIPLAALLLKPFKYWLSQSFHYFGSWFAIAYFTQAIAATCAIRSLGQRTILATIAAAFMSLMMPVLLWQTDNIALATHAYLLFGLALYFTGLQAPRLFKEVTHVFTLLLSFALLTHPYLLLMTSAFYFALLGEHWAKSDRNQHNCLIALGITSTVIIMILVMGGYFNQTLRMGGYGCYSMNLAAPFAGGKLGQRIVNATSGQARGFNYLGIGVLLSVLVSLITHRRRITDTIYQHRIFVSILTILTLFAISNHVFIGKHTVIRYPLFFPFTVISDIFRSSGRLFWPCSYTLMLVGLVGILRIKDKLLSFVGIVLVLGIQFYDVTPLRHTLYHIARSPSLTSNHWNQLVRSVSSIHMYPVYGCGNHAPQGIVFWQKLAARHNKPINTAYRSNKKSNCVAKQSVFNKPLVKGPLYIVSKEQRSLPHHISFAMDQGWCRRTEKGILCIKGTDYEWWKSHLPTKKVTQYSNKAKVKPQPKKKKYDWGWPDSVP